MPLARRHRSFVLSPLLLVAALLAPPLASAQPLDDPDLEIARRHFEKGRKFYEARAYERALAEFEEARLVKPLPALDFNIARCLDRLERTPQAIAAYERFTQGTPDPFDAEEARQRIKILKARLAAKAARDGTNASAAGADAPVKRTPAPRPPPPARAEEQPAIDGEAEAAEVAPTPAPPPEPGETPKRRSFALPIGVGVAGLALSLTGVALVGSVVSPYSRLDATCRPNCAPAEVNGLEARANAGYALLAIGGAALAVDVVLWVLAMRRPPARVAVAPGIVSATFAGEF